jgi:hypothetical protein
MLLLARATGAAICTKWCNSRERISYVRRSLLNGISNYKGGSNAKMQMHEGT